MSTRAHRPSLREIASDRTLVLMLGLAYGTGLPFLLIFSAQSARLAQADVPVETIGLFSWVLLCYSLKFLWSPLIDRVDVPWLARRLGRRRAWLLTAQSGVILGLVGLGLGDPARSLGFIVACCVFTAFCGATQDIVVDGWRIDAAPAERQGVMAATYQLGYRLAILSAGLGSFYIAQVAGWRTAYLTMAALMLVGVATGLAAPRATERERTLAPAGGEALQRAYLSSLSTPGLDTFANALRLVAGALCAGMAWSAWMIASEGTSVGRVFGLCAAAFLAILDGALLAYATGPSERAQSIRAAVDRAFVAPIADLVARYRWWLALIVLLVALYRLPDFLTGVMANPLYIKLGFQLSEIATMTKFFGVVVGLLGAFSGGIAIARIGLMPSLLIGGLAASSSHLSLALLAMHGHSLPLLALSVALEQFAGAFAGTALIAYMSSLVSPTMAASQYALLSSLYALPGKLIGGLSGYAVATFGFPTFFVLSSTVAVPVALLCLAIWAHQRGLARRHGVAGIVAGA